MREPARSMQEPLERSDVPRWLVETDVAVVGLGCAGACAAVEAAEAGAETLVLEAAPMGGGTSAMSGGLIYLGGGTPVQQQCGFSDTPEEMARFLSAACGPGVDEAKVQLYCESSVDHFHWLVEHGVPFEARFHPEPNREPPDDSGLVFSGGEDSWPFTEIAIPAPRGHHPKFPDAAGGFLMQRLIAAVDATPARLRTDAAVDRLVVDDGEVVGLEVLLDGEGHYVRARKGVVLTAGGFMFNEGMVAENCPAALRCNVPLGTRWDDGRAIRMAQGAGAAVMGMDHLEVGIPLTPPRRVVRGIIVNTRGERFINEDAYSGRLGQEFLLRQGGKVYFVHDDDTFEVNIAGYKPRWVADSAADLEADIGLPPGSLQQTLDRYNEHAVRGDDPEFHKAAQWVTPLQPPYGVVDLGVDNSYYATFTLGGLATSTEGAVLDTSGRAIPGLFAAGRSTAGIAAAGYVSGISLGDSTFFGRRAGRCAATHATG
ncbi:MAG: Fumarate reductase flavoprotein subunit [Acidimicrobiales bacterium]|nr:Fumarate reductase flavoprotein subunit [Acidimicrobiales bacterium]